MEKEHEAKGGSGNRVYPEVVYPPTEGNPPPPGTYVPPLQEYPHPQQGYPGAQQGYPGAQQGYAGAQQGYPGAQQGYPGAQHGYLQTAGVQTVVIQNNIKDTPPNYLWLSCLTLWCCNIIFGIIGTILSFVSINRAEADDLEVAKTFGQAALGVNVAGIIITVIIILLVIVIMVVLVKSVADGLM